MANLIDPTIISIYRRNAVMLFFWVTYLFFFSYLGHGLMAFLRFVGLRFNSLTIVFLGL